MPIIPLTQETEAGGLIVSLRLTCAKPLSQKQKQNIYEKATGVAQVV
jgi:hypothetical protein